MTESGTLKEFYWKLKLHINWSKMNTYKVIIIRIYLKLLFIGNRTNSQYRWMNNSNPI